MRKFLLASSLLLGLIAAGCSNPNMRGSSTSDSYPPSVDPTKRPDFTPGEQKESAPESSDSGYNESNTPSTPTR